LNGRGQTIAGFRITNKDFVSGDVFTLPAGSYGDITVVSNANGVITLSGTTATISQWQTALRALRLQLGNGGGSAREFEFHMQPSKNYWLDNGHFYEQVNTGSAMTQVAAEPLATARSMFGVAGYLVTPNTLPENTFIASLITMPSGAWSGLQKTSSGATTVKTAAVGSPNNGTALGYSNWTAGEPNLASDLCVQIYPTGGWNDISCSTNAYPHGFLVEFGGTGVAVADLVKTGSIAVDNIGPTLTLTRTAANQTGPSVQFRLTGNEPLDCTSVTSADFTLTGMNNLVATQLSPTVCAISATATAAEGTTGPVSLAISGAFSVTDVAQNASTTVTAGASLTVTVAVPDSTPPQVLSFVAEAASSTTRTLTFVLTADEPVDCSTLGAADFSFSGARFVGASVDPSDDKICRVIAVATVAPGSAVSTSATISGAFSLSDVLGNASTPGAASQSVASTSVNIPLASGSGSIISTLVAGTLPSTVVANAPTPLSGVTSTEQTAMVNAKILAPTAGAPTAVVESDISYLTAADPIALQKVTTVDAGSQVKFQIKVAPELSATHDVVGYLNVGATWVYMGRQPFSSDLVVTSPMTFAEVGTYVMK
jgi:hypothetical protein